jgi:hypothetical protein
MDKAKFLVQGFQQEPYEVLIEKNGDNLTALCTCPAGLNGMHCKHRFEIFEGNMNRIISGNKSDVLKVMDWLRGTDVERFMHEVKELEAIVEKNKKELKILKKKLARSMLD